MPVVMGWIIYFVDQISHQKLPEALIFQDSEGETVSKETLQASTSKSQLYPLEYVEARLEYVEQVNERLQQSVRFVSGDQWISETIIRVMWLEARTLREGMDSQHEHVRAVIKKVK